MAAMLQISHSTVGSYVRRAREAGVSWPLPDELDDRSLEAALYPPTTPSRVRRPLRTWCGYPVEGCPRPLARGRAAL